MPSARQIFPTLLFLCAMVLGGHGLAQNIDQETLVVDDISRQISRAADRLNEEKLSDEQLVELQLQIGTLETELFDYALEFKPKLDTIRTRLEELGAVPEDGAAPEAAIVTQERQRLSDEKAQINALLGEAEAKAVLANEISRQVTDLRREIFSRTLFERADLRQAVGPEVRQALASERRQLGTVLSSWAVFAWKYKTNALLAAMAISLLAIGLTVWFGRRISVRLLSQRQPHDQPYYLTRLTMAFVSAVVPALVVVLGLTASYAIFAQLNLFRDDVGAIVRSAFMAIAGIYFSYRLAYSILAPKMPGWRLLQVTDRGARVLLWLFVLTAGVYFTDFFVDRITNILDSDLTLTISKGLFASLLIGSLIIVTAWVRPFAKEESERPAPWPRLIRWPMLAAGVFLIGAALSGYVGLARFASQQIVLTGAILITMFIGLSSARAISDRGKLAQTRTGRRLIERYKFDDTGMDQLSLVAALLITALVIVVGLPLIMMQWGFQFAEIRALAWRFGSGFSLGNVRISFSGILIGILVFAVGVLISRGFQRWLDNTVMSRGRIDPGVRNSIRTAAGYVGIALAGLLAIAAAGINLSSLAFVAGALSLGIGFGLQNIVSNFVSGLILLAERPIKVGDWVITSSTEGFVRKISVRATEIETFHRQTVIVPNSEFINAPVSNWTHRNSLGRIDIDVGVAYDSDPKKVHGLLLGAAADHALVLKNPEPFVALLGFGESSIDFQLRVYIANILDKPRVGNDLYFRVFDLLKDAGIEIPFPQRDLHIRSANEKLSVFSTDEENTTYASKRS